MVVPKIHTDSLNDFKPQQAAEYLKILGEYEKKGYNVYARAPNSKIKTITHQHTHLISAKGKKKFIFYTNKPFYMRISY